MALITWRANAYLLICDLDLTESSLKAGSAEATSVSLAGEPRPGAGGEHLPGRGPVFSLCPVQPYAQVRHEGDRQGRQDLPHRKARRLPEQFHLFHLKKYPFRSFKANDLNGLRFAFPTTGPGSRFTLERNITIVRGDSGTGKTIIPT